MKTPEELRFMSDIYLFAARDYYYMEGDDSVSTELFWKACALGEFANVVEEMEGQE